jgi:hypothetical protein
MGVGGQRHALAAFPPEKRSDTHCTEGWVGPRAGLKGGGGGAENLALTGIRSLARPARSESLYRPSYPGAH